MRDVLEVLGLIALAIVGVLGFIAVWIGTICMALAPFVLAVAGVFLAWKWVFG